ncbi:hypothetical protein [Shimazuella kribbensis]|uniref:hypothetical protein n=1 Tax=Shimazuella kribbensis TaxID=139808 RepID=UPI000490A9AC|nr:hypothetical protein [Shimazuella kribbensis]
MSYWNKEDLTQYNHAEEPHYSVQINGKVDISPLTGDKGTEHRISLQPWGMYKLVEEWLQSGHRLSKGWR